MKTTETETDGTFRLPHRLLEGDRATCLLSPIGQALFANMVVSGAMHAPELCVELHRQLPIGIVFRRDDRRTQGWSLSGVSRLATGFPVRLLNNNDTSLLGSIPYGINNNGVDAPNLTSGNLALNANPRNGMPRRRTCGRPSQNRWNFALRRSTFSSTRSSMVPLRSTETSKSSHFG